MRAQSEGGLESSQAASLQVWLGLAWLVGCLVWGGLSLQRSRECQEESPLAALKTSSQNNYLYRDDIRRSM